MLLALAEDAHDIFEYALEAFSIFMLFIKWHSGWFIYTFVIILFGDRDKELTTCIKYTVTLELMYSHVIIAGTIDNAIKGAGSNDRNDNAFATKALNTTTLLTLQATSK